MKKILFVSALLCLTGISKADVLGDQITASLINHVSANSEWTTKGENRLAFLTDIVELGKLQGSAIGQLRFGYNSVVDQQGGQVPGGGYVADAYMNISPFIRQYVNINKDWVFLNSVEMGPSFSYDFRAHHSYLAFSVGLAFGLQPLP